MKSIKPGRGPSIMTGISSIAAALFGLVWIFMTFRMGAGFMSIFGVIFVGLAIFQAVYNLKNATSENRYSSFDITDSQEEMDPFNERFGSKQRNERPHITLESCFCPYCGTALSVDFQFCNQCGKELPK